MRRLGPLGHPGALPRSTLRPSWWKWRKVYGIPWKHGGKQINVLELEALINGVLWRLRSAANIHSKGVQGMDSVVIWGALAKGRSASAAPCAFGHEVQLARGCSIFHPFGHVLADRSQIGLMISVAMAESHRHGSDCERQLDFCVTV